MASVMQFFSKKYRKMFADFENIATFALAIGNR